MNTNQNTTRPPVGSRVKLAHDVDRYPHFVAPAGATGTVVDMGDPNIYAVRLDEQLAGADEWRNELHFVLDAGDEPELALELVDDFVNRDALAAADVDELRGILRDGGPTALLDAARAELEQRETPPGRGARVADPYGRPSWRVEPPAEVELERDEQDRAYEVASADVVLALTRDEANTIAEVLADVAGSDFLGAHADYEELARLAELVRRAAAEGQS